MWLHVRNLGGINRGRECAGFPIINVNSPSFSDELSKTRAKTHGTIIAKAPVGFFCLHKEGREWKTRRDLPWERD